jgi:hypothetical protein
MKKGAEGSLNASLIKTETAIENGLALHDASTLKKTLGLQKDRHSQYIGWTTEFEPCLVELLPLDEKDESSLFRGTLRKVAEYDTFLMRSDDTTESYEKEPATLDHIQHLVGRHGPALVDLYFEVVHPSFPILHKDVFLQKYSRSHREFAPPLLAAVYILALSWWTHDPRLAPLPKPDVADLEMVALKSLVASVNRPKLATVQAGLLLLQRPRGDSWVLTAQMVAIGQELGLNHDPGDWTIPTWERGLRRRLAWALYVQDKWSCLVHGRPSHIDKSNWIVHSLTETDFPASDIGDESGDEEDGRLLFTQMVALTEVLSEILDAFYTLRAGQDIVDQGRDSTRYILDRAKPLQIQLKDWFSRLPTCLRMDNTSDQRLSPIGKESRSRLRLLTRCQGYIHLAYFATEITLHRLIIRSLTPTSAHPSPTDPYLTHICRSAAKTRLISAMDFVNRLKPTHLQAFWHFASKVNFALIGTFGCLLWASAPGREEAEFYRVRLEEYKWTLRVSVKELGFMAFASRHLDAATKLLQTMEKPLLEEVYARRAMEGQEGGSVGTSNSDYPMVDAPAGPTMFDGFDQKMGNTMEVGVIEPFRFDPQASRRSSGLVSPSTSTSTGSAGEEELGHETY